ncbi:MAG: hypothetical protein KKH84_01645 [Proteobacteria bacterium]|nr:hypothetical protein [Pseudomonadota bacterium]MBU4419692.1 hypothetical protein [Pseudomonadota bacterium]
MKFERRLRADILVENKAIKKITNQNEAQLINYFKTTRLRVGLLIIQCNSVKIRGEQIQNTACHIFSATETVLSPSKLT